MEDKALTIEQRTAIQAYAESDFKVVRSKLLSAYKFFSRLLYGLDLVFTYEVDTASTNGDTLKINPLFFMSLGHQYQLVVVAHECLHAAYGHPYRAKGKDPVLWNKAADYVVNLMLLHEFHFLLIPGMLYEEKYRSMATEEVYAMLKKQRDEERRNALSKPTQLNDSRQEQGQGQGQSSPVTVTEAFESSPMKSTRPMSVDLPKRINSLPGKGEIIRELSRVLGATGRSEGIGAVTVADVICTKNTERLWEKRTREAALEAEKVTGCGSAEGTILQAIKIENGSKNIWKEELWEYFTSPNRDELSWRSQRRQSHSIGVYLPKLRDMSAIDNAAILIDSSGSIDLSELEKFISELQQILSTIGIRRLKVITFSTKITMEKTIEEGWDVVEFLEEFKDIPGRGGTNYIPAFKSIENEGQPYDVVIVFTDLDVKAQSCPTDCSFPVLWAVTPTEGKTYLPPFGRILKL